MTGINTLSLDIAEPVLTEMSVAGEYTRIHYGDAAAELFTERVAESLTNTAARIAEEIATNVTGKPFEKPDEAASIRFSQPVYRLRVETIKRRRGSSTGLWYAYYTLQDRAGSGKPDTMYVLAWRHSAARPLDAIDGE